MGSSRPSCSLLHFLVAYCDLLVYVYALTKQLDHVHNHVHIPGYFLSATKKVNHRPWTTLTFALERCRTRIKFHTVTDMAATVEWNHPTLGCEPKAPWHFCLRLPRRTAEKHSLRTPKREIPEFIGKCHRPASSALAFAPPSSRLLAVHYICYHRHNVCCWICCVETGFSRLLKASALARRLDSSPPSPCHPRPAECPLLCHRDQGRTSPGQR